MRVVTQNEPTDTAAGSVAFVTGYQKLFHIFFFVVRQDVLVESRSARVLNQSAEPFCILLFKKNNQQGCHNVFGVCAGRFYTVNCTFSNGTICSLCSLPIQMLMKMYCRIRAGLPYSVCLMYT